MRLSIRTHLVYATTPPCDLLLQIEAAADDTQQCRETKLALDSTSVQQQIVGEEQIGTRRWITAGPQFVCDYETIVEVTRPKVEIESLIQTPLTQMPTDIVKYLMPSRYCHSELFYAFVQTQFGGLSGGVLVRAMCDWIQANFRYDSGVSHAGTTATDSFAIQAGVCRDYAHVLITFARAAGIPARFVSAYAPDVTPQDFHAVVEVYLGGSWQLLDPTGMAKPSEIARICVGRDAADASFLTSYGWINMVAQTVAVRRIGR